MVLLLVSKNSVAKGGYDSVNGITVFPVIGGIDGVNVVPDKDEEEDDDDDEEEDGAVRGFGIDGTIVDGTMEPNAVLLLLLLFVFVGDSSFTIALLSDTAFNASFCANAAAAACCC